MKAQANVGQAAAGAELARQVTALLTIRGIVALLMGVLLFASPAMASSRLALVFVIAAGIWLMFDGGTSLAAGVLGKRHGAEGNRWIMLAGLAAIVAGIGALIFPLSATLYGGLMLLWFIAFGLAARGLLELGGATAGRWGRTLGILNVLLGVLLVVMVLVNVKESLTALMWIVAVYGIVIGVASLLAAFRLKPEAGA